MDLVSNLNLGMWIFFCGFVDDCLVSSLAGPFLTFIAVSSKTCSLKLELPKLGFSSILNSNHY